MINVCIYNLIPLSGRPFGNSTVNLKKEITFTSVRVEGGGVLDIDSNGEGMVLRGDTLEVQSGGLLTVDRIDIQVSRLIIDSSAHITADGKVVIILLTVELTYLLMER